VLRPGGCVYLESPALQAALQVGPGWELLREKRMGDVRMQLFKKLAKDPASVLPT
jgi:16S rRNA G966 N2-methylase RsmD